MGTHNSFSFENEFLYVGKGACRSIPPLDENLETGLKSLGLPVVVGGSMGTASYILKNVNHEESLNSVCHGAGRKLSRFEANKTLDHDEIIQDLKDKNIILRAPENSVKTEAPRA